jgi:lipopolysaccharide transport system ATP-binding protein
MSDIVLRVEGLFKMYRLGNVGTGTLSHDLNRWWHTIRGKEDPYLKIGQTNDRSKKGASEYVWALQDINFEVNKGEVLGIIGKNGAGKSTLLKILSQVTSPTKGRVEAFGRIASLLEVGTGFHPELTGRENIFLNGAILGMRRWEIQNKFDEIVDFAGVEAYIDTPVKRYSSGMYVRLAFAVAAFLEPDILIIDEVLAVGDADFQAKCLGRMKDVSKNEGRTVLFVSHNMEAIKALCPKALLMKDGLMVKKGSTSEVVNLYLGNTSNSGQTLYEFSGERYENMFISQAELLINGIPTQQYSNGNKIEVRVKVVGKVDTAFSFEILIKDQYGQPILFCPQGLLTGTSFKILAEETKSYVINTNLPFLASGQYLIDIMVAESGKKFYHYVENAFTVLIGANFIPTSSWNFKQSGGQGSIILDSVRINQISNV